MKRAFRFQKIFAEVSGRLIRRAESRPGKGFMFVDAFIPLACFLIFLDPQPASSLSTSDGLPSAFAIFLMLAPLFALPFQLRYGWKQLIGRLLMIASGSVAILDFILGPFYSYTFVPQCTIEFIILCSGLAYTLSVMDAGKRNEQLDNIERFVKGHKLDDPFFFADLTSYSIDIHHLEKILPGIRAHEVGIMSVFQFEIAYSTEDSCFCIVDAGKAFDFLLIGVSFTGFDFLICHVTASQAHAGKVLKEMRAKIFEFAREFSEYPEIEISDLLLFKSDHTGVWRDWLTDSELLKDIRLQVRMNSDVSARSLHYMKRH